MIDIIEGLYRKYEAEMDEVRLITGQPLTFAEKVLYLHLNNTEPKTLVRGESYADFRPDRVAMQDATAQMALLQFMQAGKEKVAVPTSVHCDHLIQAKTGAETDLVNGCELNREVYDFLSSVSKKYGIGFWKPGAGIIHQTVLENYAFPGGMMIGTDSHSPNAGGLGMAAIGVGGADAVDVMAGMGWEVKFPRIIGVKLIGKLSGWTAAKDVILDLLGQLTVKGGTGAIIEYFGDGATSLSCTGKATICNMGAELGATCSIFPYDAKMGNYLEKTGRVEVARAADKIARHLQADPEVLKNPEHYYDQVVELDLSILEPHINGPLSPDRAWKISEFKKAIEDNNFPKTCSVGLIGSCTNSSYEDMSRAASIAGQAIKKGIPRKADYFITPGSDLVSNTLKRDGILEVFDQVGGTILANACGPCIGQWERRGAEKQEHNSIITSFNRNFSKRADGNPNTQAFVASPEIVTALVIAGDMAFNPLTDTLTNNHGEQVLLDEPVGREFPQDGFMKSEGGYIAPERDGRGVVVKISDTSERLQFLQPFKPNNEQDFKRLKLLLKVKGKCTTDHISMAGPWLKYRGHLDNISNNMFIGAINVFNDCANKVKNQLTGGYGEVPATAREYKEKDVSTIVIGDENYGEGSSREHAAMEPRHLGVKVVLVRSFARIHETNLKKQGILAITFLDKNDYDLIQEDDTFEIRGLTDFNPGTNLLLVAHHDDGSRNEIGVQHTYNANQIQWFKAGSALNYIKNSN